MRFFYILIALCVAVPAQASLSPDAQEHARSAFSFADGKDWPEARQHARASGEDALVTLIDWQYMLDPDSTASFGEITDFMSGKPDWPDQKKLRIRAEIALRDGATDDASILQWFGRETPITGIGKLALAEALKRQKQASPERLAALIRNAWKDGDFDESQEKHLLDTYGDWLKPADHNARTDRLLWEERVAPAKRMLPLLSSDYQKLYKARIALIEDKTTAPILVLEVPKALRRDPGFLYDRIRYRARHEDTEGARDLLLIAPAHPPYPEKWWKLRELEVREAIDERDYKLARKLLANHGQTEGNSFAEATWLSGWLQCEFLNQPKNAFSLFYQMYNAVKYPVSRSRAAYWAARAAEKSGNKPEARKWYGIASGYPTNFYGQLAAVKLYGDAPLRFPPPTSVSTEELEAFDASELGRAIRISAELGQDNLANRLIGYLAENADTPQQALLAAGYGKYIGNDYLSVRGAKKAIKQNLVMLDVGYPAPDTPKDVPIERALTLAITRQESEFDRKAKSPSGALGMMQLLPGTAKETAHKNDMGYDIDRLYEPEYNMTLGSLYLGRLISSYDGSYIMAIAAYNGGPGNVRKWTNQFNTPGKDVDGAVDWIEKIPFKETRNYVQRVLENVQVYRHIEAGGTPQKSGLAEDLTR